MGFKELAERTGKVDNPNPCTRIGDAPFHQKIGNVFVGLGDADCDRRPRWGSCFQNDDQEILKGRL